jgi:diguanylate cyclase (GGDEF)-like protein
MLAPLAGEDVMRGLVLAANAKGNVHTFKRDELSLFETFASHLGVTLEKSQLNSSLAQLRALKNELAHQAYHDSLTGLANRVLFRERVTAGLENVAANGSGLAVLFIDLDDFKTVNDTMGHAAGDTLLRVIGERITSCIGVEDTAARLGGDEFAVLLTNATNDADVRVVADRILLALGDPVDIEGQPVVAHASIGVATHASANDADALMQNADVAMYTAKRNGKGRCDVFEPALSMSVANRHQVKMGLERAVGTDEFVLHFQPVVNIVTGEIVATEALLRWRDPARGLLPPAEFIAIAEETGLIVPIGRFVLREACRQAKEWEPLAPDVRMFVNLSARQLLDPSLLEDVQRALHDANLDPSRLVLEVTETAMMQDIEYAQTTLTALKAIGVGLGVDDFGTGYSSLSYLRQLPIDVLKIAKPFIDAVDETPEDAEFVRGIVQIGHVVGLHVVAEGVERVEQSARLIEMGCDSAQGYYYARSLEPAAIVALLRRANIERTIKAFAKAPESQQQRTTA